MNYIAIARGGDKPWTSAPPRWGAADDRLPSGAGPNTRRFRPRGPPISSPTPWRPNLLVIDIRKPFRLDELAGTVRRLLAAGRTTPAAG
jgi:hypothetical protein